MNKLAALLKEVGARNSKGGQDTELAHVNPAESRLLKLLGGSGRIDPVTGLKHYDDGDSGDGSDSSDSGDDSGYSSGDDGDSGWGGDSSENSFDDGSMASSMGQGPDGSWGGSQENSFDDGSMANSMGQGPDGSWGSAQENSFDNGSMAASMGQNVDGTWGDVGNSDFASYQNEVGLAELGDVTGPQQAQQQDTDVYGDTINNDAGFSGGYGAPGGGLAGEYSASGFSSGTDTAGAAEGGYATLDDDGTGKGRSGTAFGPGGELEGFGQWSQEFGNSLGSHGWDAAKSNAWMADLLGYDPNATSLGDVVNGAKDALGLGYVGAGVPGQAMNSVAGGRSTATEDGLPNEDAMSGGMSAAGTHSAFSTGTAAQAGNAVANNGAGPGGRGDTFDNVTNAYEDSPFSWNAENNQGGGLGGYANQAVIESRDWLNEHPNMSGLINMGLGLVNPALGLAANVISSGIRGNYTPGISALGTLLGGPQVGQGVNALSNLLSGTPGNTIAGLGSGYLNSISPGLGSVLNATGITGMGARGINEAFQTALNEARNAEVDGDLSTEGTSFFSNGGDDNYASAPSEMTTSQMMDPEPVYAEAPQQLSPAASFAGPTYTPFGGGGSDGGEVGNEFLGSKKKTRYMQNQLMALLGGRDAA